MTSYQYDLNERQLATLEAIADGDTDLPQYDQRTINALWRRQFVALTKHFVKVTAKGKNYIAERTANAS